MTVFSVDVETSGLNPILNDVTSIAVIEAETERYYICRLDDPTIVWDEDTRVWADKNIPASVATFPLRTPAQACSELNTFLDQFPKPWTFMAWPASFDYPFVQKLYSKSDSPFPFHYRTIDLHSLLVGKFGGDISAGRGEGDLPGIVVEPTDEYIHDPYWDAWYQLQTYNNYRYGRSA